MALTICSLALRLGIPLDAYARIVGAQLPFRAGETQNFRHTREGEVAGWYGRRDY